MTSLSNICLYFLLFICSLRGFVALHFFRHREKILSLQVYQSDYYSRNQPRKYTSVHGVNKQIWQYAIISGIYNAIKQYTKQYVRVLKGDHTRLQDTRLCKDYVQKVQKVDRLCIELCNQNYVRLCIKGRVYKKHTRVEYTRENKERVQRVYTKICTKDIQGRYNVYIYICIQNIYKIHIYIRYTKYVYTGENMY